MKNRPTYAIASVDNALRLATVLQLEGPLTVSEAAERLGVARSTAHRLLGMLCYRDFAVQGDDRTYQAGPVLGTAGSSRESAARMRALALPHLAALTDSVNETTNLTVLAGRLVRFLASVECQHVLRVGTREGMAFPAYRTSGGLAMLAQLPKEEVDDLIFTAPRDDDGLPAPAALRHQLAMVRTRGFAINDGKTESGITAIGVAITDPLDGGLAGLSLSMPSVRFSRDRVPEYAGHLMVAKARIEADLADRREATLARGGEAARPGA